MVSSGHLNHGVGDLGLTTGEQTMYIPCIITPKDVVCIGFDDNGLIPMTWYNA